MADISLAKSQMMLLAGSANRPLAEEIAAELKQPLCQVTIRRFADGELFVKHPVFGDLTLGEFMTFHVRHAEHHAKQVKARIP